MRRGIVTTLQIGVIVIFVALAAAVWMVVRGLDAGGRLSDARAAIQRVRADLLAGRSAVADMRAAQVDAAAARRDTHDPVWGAASWLAPVKSVRGVTEAVDILAKSALPDVVRVGPSLRPAVLRVRHNTIALQPLVDAAPTMQHAAAAASLARSQVASLPDGWIGLVNTARDEVQQELSSLAGSLDDISRVATAGPAMLGQDGVRRYFVGIQNNAEARATGGLVAAYAIVTADKGTIKVVEHGNDVALNRFVAPKPVVALNRQYEQEYGNYHPAQDWHTSNLSPNFPDAANIWAHMWSAQSGQHIDGAFGVDPVGLSQVLDAVGPVVVPNYRGVFSGANLATFIESTEYSAFPGLNSLLRKNFLGDVASAVIHKMLSGSGTPQAITTALGRAAGDGHLELWSAVAAEQAQISGTPLAGELSRSQAPFASVAIDNGTGSKLDYYLDRSLRYDAGGCSAARRDSTITVTLTNAAPLHGLPAYVRFVTTAHGGDTVERVPNNREFVFIHATAGATLLNATVDGKVVQVGSGFEAGHPVYLVMLRLQPNVPRTIALHLSEPAVPGKATTQVQPLARPQSTVIDVPRCG